MEKLAIEGSDLPEAQYLSNTLQTEFELDPSLHTEFVETYKANCKFLGIGHQYDGIQQSVSSVNTQFDSGSNLILTSDGDGPVCFVIMPFTEREESP